MGMWDWVPSVVSAGATLYGAYQSSKSNDKAAAIASDAQDRATDAQIQALNTATRLMTQQQQQASPGLVALQRVLGSADELTPTQIRAIEDARRTSLDSLQGGSLRGSAGATAAVVRDVEGRMTDQFMQSNRNRADQAASNLSGQYFNAGKNVADLTLGTGTAASQGLINTGNINAANTMGQGAIRGQAIGDIGAIIAAQMKDDDIKTRQSSYAPTVSYAPTRKEDIIWNSERKGVVA